MCELACVSVCVVGGVDVCWAALTVRPFQAYITERAGLFPIATLAEVKGYVPHIHHHHCPLLKNLNLISDWLIYASNKRWTSCFIALTFTLNTELYGVKSCINEVTLRIPLNSPHPYLLLI